MSASKESTGRLALETVVLLGLRAVYFGLAQQYLQRSLYADLRQVIRDETSTAGASYGANSSGFGPSSPDSQEDQPGTPFSAVPGNGQSFRDQLYNLRSGATSSNSVILPAMSASSTSTAAGRANMSNRRRSGSGANTRVLRENASKAGAGVPRTLSSAVFCLSVSECMTLFTLLLFGAVVGPLARYLNWTMSLVIVLALIVLIIPLGMSLLFSMRTKATSASTKRLVFVTAIPFGAWLLGLFTVGNWLAIVMGVETGKQTGIIAMTLDRLCVPGTVLIAALSGGAAVNSAWEAFIWRERFRSEAVTDGHINAAARSLAQMRHDLAGRRAEIAALQSSSNSDGQSQGFFSKVFGSSPHATKVKSLQDEIAGLEAMEAQMTRDLHLIKRRKEISELSKTWTGFARQTLGYIFSIYCVYRILVSGFNLVFGHYFASGSPEGQKRTPPADLAGAVFSYIATAFGWDIDVHTWSKVAGLVLVGSIIIVNMNFVLSYVSRVFRATSAGNSASFMLLFLSQLMSIYLITSLISLPTSDADNEKGAAPLLETLPDFRIFTRLFDAVFLMTAVSVFVIRYIQRKVVVSEQLGLDDYV